MRRRNGSRSRLSLLLGVLSAALAACSSAPRAPAHPPTTLAEVNLALSWHFADVTLANRVVMHGLRSVEVTADELRWTNDQGQQREMPIGEVVRIVLRGEDPAAPPPTEGSRMLGGPLPADSSATAGSGTGFGSASGKSAAVAGAVYGALAIATSQTWDPGEVIYEAPVTRYLPAPVADPAPAEDPPSRLPILHEAD